MIVQRGLAQLRRVLAPLAIAAGSGAGLELSRWAPDVIGKLLSRSPGHKIITSQRRRPRGSVVGSATAARGSDVAVHECPRFLRLCERGVSEEVVLRGAWVAVRPSVVADKGISGAGVVFRGARLPLVRSVLMAVSEGIAVRRWLALLVTLPTWVRCVAGWANSIAADTGRCRPQRCAQPRRRDGR